MCRAWSQEIFKLNDEQHDFLFLWMHIFIESEENQTISQLIKSKKAGRTFALASAGEWGKTPHFNCRYNSSVSTFLSSF